MSIDYMTAIKKSLVLLFLPLYVLFGEVDSLSTSPSSYFISISAYGSGGLNIVTAPSRENVLSFNPIPSVFAAFQKILNDTSHTTLGVQAGFLSQVFKIKSQNLATEFLSSSNSFDFTINYLSLDVLFSTFGITFGFGYKYPVGGKFKSEIPTENLASVFDCLLGYSFNLYSDEENSICASFLLRYPLKKIYKNYPESDPVISFENATQKQNIANKHNPAILWFGFGIIYRYSF
jgi:hypothetical protein